VGCTTSQLNAKRVGPYGSPTFGGPLLRRWVGIVALLGVLLHASAVVRHNSATLGSHLQHQSLLVGLLQLCSGAGGLVETQSADVPFIPSPTDAQTGCPICAGFASAFALIGPGPIVLAQMSPAGPAVQACATKAPRSSSQHHPPARGPPPALA
jgi:hypothetical protein